MELITKAQAAEMLTVSEDTVDRLVKSGQLVGYRITRNILRFTVEDVEEYLASRRTKAATLAKRKSGRRPDEFRGGINNSGYYPGMQVVKP